MRTTFGKFRPPATADKRGAHPRPARGLSALAASAMVAGSLFGGTAAHVVGPVGQQQHAVALVATIDSILPGDNPLGEGGGLISYVIDDLLGIGDKTLPELIVNPFTGASPTFGEMVGWLGISVHDEFSDVFVQLGLHNVTIDGILTFVGFSQTETISDAMERALGPFSSLFEFPTDPDADPDELNLYDMTIGEVLNQLGLDPDQPLDELLSSLPAGPDPTDTLGEQTMAQILNVLLLPDQTAVPESGVDDSTTLADYLTGIGLGTFTIDELLGLDAPEAVLF